MKVLPPDFVADLVVQFVLSYGMVAATPEVDRNLGVVVPVIMHHEDVVDRAVKLAKATQVALLANRFAVIADDRQYGLDEYFAERAQHSEG